LSPNLLKIGGRITISVRRINPPYRPAVHYKAAFATATGAHSTAANT